MTFRNRRALGIIITTLMILIITSALGIAVLAYSQGKLGTFKSTVETIFAANMNTVQDLLVLENIVYHSSTQQFNLTFTNTGYSPVNVTTIKIIRNTTPSFNEIATTSGTWPVSMITKPNYLSTSSERVTVPGAIISPGAAYTTVIPYHCFCDPITVTATTSHGAVITKNVAPNVGWYSSLEQYRKRITIDYTKVVGNPSAIILDNQQDANGTTSASKFTLSSFTVNSGDNRLLLVTVVSNTGTVSGITYGATSLIKDVSMANTVDSEIWYLKNPSSGKADIVVTMSGSASVVVSAYSYFGIDQTTPLGAIPSSSGVSGNSASESLSLTTSYFNSTVVDVVAVAGKNTLTPNAGQTMHAALIDTLVSGGSSSKFIPLTSTASMGWFWTGAAANYAATAVEVRSSDYINFPLVINMTDTSLMQYASSSGNDIVFTACDGVTKLNYELENFTQSTGNLQAWVQLPHLYSTPDNIIYMYYGNSNAPYQQNVGGTWDSTYFGVWHMQQNPSNVIAMDGSPANASGTTSLVGGHYQFPLNNFPVHAGKDGLLLVQVQMTNNYPSNVTFNGIMLTNAVESPSNAKAVNTGIWYLVNPPAVTANIVVGTDTTLSPRSVNVGAYSFWNVDQSSPFPTTNTEGSTVSSPVTLSITTKYPNSWVIDSFVVNIASSTLTTNNAGQILGYSVNQGAISAGSSYQSTTIPGSITTGWKNWSNPQKQAMVQVELKAPPTITDSTNNHNDFNASNVVSTGQIQGELGYGLNFDGVNNYLSRVNGLTNPPNTQGPQTASIWFWYPSGSRGSFAQDIFTLETTGGGSAVQMGYTSSTTFDVWKYGSTVMTTTSVPSAATWHNAVYTYDGNGNGQGITHRLYIDGILKTTSTTSPQSGTPGQLFVGSNNCHNCELVNSRLDEFEYSTMVRSASWIATQYNNQASPSTFVSVGAQESSLTPRNSN